MRSQQPGLVHRDGLTGVRALAALSVCATHAAFWTGLYTPDAQGYFFGRLEIGVAIFFVLSGYLLYQPWVSALQRQRPAPSIGRFYARRARRILVPLWLTVIAGYLIALARNEVHPTPGQLFRNLTLTQIYGSGQMLPGLTHLWSLAVEVVFYLMLPLIAAMTAYVVCRNEWLPERIIVVTLALMSVSMVWAVRTHSGDGDPTARLWPPAFVLWFAGGMLLAVVAHLVSRCSTALCWSVAAVAFGAACTSIAGEPTITPTTLTATLIKSVLYLIVGVGLLAPIAINPPGSTADRVFGSRPVMWAGEISYEFFLVHVIVLELAMSWLGYATFQGSFVVAFAVTTVISVPVAAALHWLTRPIWRRRPHRVGRDTEIGHTGKTRTRQEQHQ